jgi:hypothetical protein
MYVYAQFQKFSRSLPRDLADTFEQITLRHWFILLYYTAHVMCVTDVRID